MVANKVTTMVENPFVTKGKKVQIAHHLERSPMTTIDPKKATTSPETSEPMMNLKEDLQDDFDDIEYDDGSYADIEIDYTTQY